ncbi:hypothetical protein B0H13DRAFT_2024068 [Mycena leptocephala]|nr:hypothetical protein B0H13DRAFT_2024068 [Mycena leptocephala]
MDPSDSDSDIVALDGPTNYADNDVDGMILATARAHPEATRKFLVRTPALMAKQAKNQQQKERRAEKAAAKRKQNDAEADDDDEPKAKKAKGKAKKDLDDPPPSITYYINIPKPPPLTKKRGAKAADDDCLQKGPFSLPTSESYSTLLSSMAAELPCRKENINESKITWKPKKPKNGEKLPLGKNTGYQAMVTEMEGKAPEGRVVLLFMPPPTKPMEEATPWETNDEPVPSFDYTQLEPTGAADSVAQQKESFNKATKEERMKLEEKYTIGNYPNFPDRRVYFDAQTGFYFELNASRLGIWASAMAQGTTDENKPPTSKFFDANQRIKTIPSVAVPAPAPAVLAPPALTAVPAPTGSSLSLSDLLLASLLGGGGIAAMLPGFNLPGLPVPQPSAPAPAPNPVPHLRSTPPSPVKRHTVPLDRFCELYALDAADAALLKSVGFRPGDHTGPTLDEQLAKFGFTYFSWQRIHGANLRFKADLASGTYD